MHKSRDKRKIYAIYDLNIIVNGNINLTQQPRSMLS